MPKNRRFLTVQIPLLSNGNWESMAFIFFFFWRFRGDWEGGVLICFYFLYYNDERDEGQTLWFALVWKILSKRGWEKEGGIGSMSFS